MGVGSRFADSYRPLATDGRIMSAPVVIPGGRDVRGRLDSPDADSAVVACPPHPQHGGSRADPRLRAVSDALAPEVACLRFDYGDWDGGEGETVDAGNALSWAADRFRRVGLFGYSFGAGVALRAAARADAPPDACSVLAPPGDAGAVLHSVECPVQVVVGERDAAVEWAPVADRAAALGHAVERLSATHQFSGDRDRVGRVVGRFLRARR
jgi:alpha/beta superfamily hydrolase